jgi:DNA-3-methyladenine glycosylase
MNSRSRPSGNLSRDIFPEGKKLDPAFYLQTALPAARRLLGMRLVTRIGGRITSGIISETEAYLGVTDRASHAWGGRRTGRTEIMYAEGGVAYVYLCYGIHSLFNVVVGRAGNPHAVLIRAIRPEQGIGLMQKRRNMAGAGPRLAAGPGTAAQALGIHYSHSGLSLLGSVIWIEEADQARARDILATPRIGVDYAGPDARLPYRFVLKN